MRPCDPLQMCPQITVMRVWAIPIPEPQRLAETGARKGALRTHHMAARLNHLHKSPHFPLFLMAQAELLLGPTVKRWMCERLFSGSGVVTLTGRSHPPLFLWLLSVAMTHVWLVSHHDSFSARHTRSVVLCITYCNRALFVYTEVKTVYCQLSTVDDSPSVTSCFCCTPRSVQFDL